MKDLQTVLRQKEEDVERVRREIRALLIVIPLLADDQRSPGAEDQPQSASSRTKMDDSSKSMRDLETYYPFTRYVDSSKPQSRR